MKKYVLTLEKDYMVALLMVVGIFLIIFPDELSVYAPYVVGGGLCIFSLYNLFVSLHYPGSGAELGQSLISMAIGAVLLLQRNDPAAIDKLGVIWAVRTLSEASLEITEMYEHKKARVIDIIEIVISVALAVLLLMNPFHHFSFHVRVLGIEILISAFVRRRRKLVGLDS